MIKAVVFDLDDTLISESEYIKSGYLHIAKVIEDKHLIDRNKVFEDFMTLFNSSSLNVFNRFFEKYEIEYSNEMIMDLVAEYRSHTPNIKFYEDVVPCLSELIRGGITLGIITDGYSISQRQKLKAVQAEKYFDYIIVTDELGREYWKPHPRSFELMKDRMNVNFEEMIYIGDNPNKDFVVIEDIPISTIRILRRGIYDHIPYAKNVYPTYTIDGLTKLLSLIGEL